MSIRVQFDFDRKVLDSISRLGKNSRNAFAKALLQGAYLIEGEIKQSMARGTKSGRVYPRNQQKAKKKRIHRASAPGESPAVDHGRLISSLRVEEVTDIRMKIGSKLIYAAYLEEGTDKMQPRPYLLPALEKSKGKIDSLIERALNSVVR